MPRQPEPSKTTLIISADTPKSVMINTGSPPAIASSAAVDDTVTRPRAVASASAIPPPTQRTASGSTRPLAISSANSCG